MVADGQGAMFDLVQMKDELGELKRLTYTGVRRSVNPSIRS